MPRRLPGGVCCTAISQDVNTGAAAPLRDRCFVHPHGYVDGTTGLGSGVDGGGVGNSLRVRGLLNGEQLSSPDRKLVTR